MEDTATYGVTRTDLVDMSIEALLDKIDVPAYFLFFCFGLAEHL